MARTDVDSKVQPFAEQVAEGAGENLVALLVRGSAARGDFDPKRSDINLVIILREASAQALRPLGSAVAKWIKSGHPPPVIFTEEGWKASTDVFPIEIEDMRQAHRLVRGTDPFDGLETTGDDVRRELEREARGKLIQLRTEYVGAETNGKALGALLIDSAKTFFVLFRALVRVKGRVPPQDPHGLVEDAAAIAGFDATALEWILARLRGDKRPDLNAYDPAGARYLDAITRFVQYVDEM